MFSEFPTRLDSNRPPLFEHSTSNLEITITETSDIMILVKLVEANNKDADLNAIDSSRCSSSRTNVDIFGYHARNNEMGHIWFLFPYIVLKCLQSDIKSYGISNNFSFCCLVILLTLPSQKAMIELTIPD